ncbi:hypothetical protein [Bradyrhizobium sp.]|uniref:hypothetical protein n=1 Tax=Bradyrhizobium sp. TaxID=376 RepID=UPI0025B8064B|nr:hypothetical protein [Bradyrhizobium sp.]
MTLAANSDQISISAMTLTQKLLISAGTDQGTESMNAESMNAVNTANSARLMAAAEVNGSIL